MWQNWTNLTLGVWLLTAAFIPAVTTAPSASMWNNSLTGSIAMLAGGISAVSNKQKMCWINGTIGAWLITSAFIQSIVGQFNFWNDLISGALIITVSTWAITRNGTSNTAQD